jgi:xanthine dehydrogenase accessory factor
MGPLWDSCRAVALGVSVIPEERAVREVLPALMTAYERGESAAMATVVRTWRSAPRPAGASMLVTEGGEAVGSVSGGCVEGALYDLGTEVLGDGVPQYETYGISDGDAFAVGLTCGGILEVFVERVSPQTWPELRGIAASVEAEVPVAVATIVKGPDHVGRHLVVRGDGVEGSLGTPRLDDTVGADVRGLLESGTTGFLHYGPDGERLGTELEVFVASFAPAPRMVIFGAIDFSAALARAGKLLGFHVTVVDAREVFATRKRFPDADEVVVDWPHRWLASQEVDARTVICVLTHDPKFDVPALKQAVTTRAAYIGAMGSRRTHADRLVRLKDAGLTDQEIERIHSPIGLDLGARTPEETAISIAAEIVQARWGGSGRNLVEADGPIHAGAPR